MSLKMTLVGAALTLSMAPLAARADDYSQQQYDQQYEQPQYQQPYDQQYQQPYQQQPGVAVGEPRPDGRFERNGHYELRTVQRWVPGQYQQVWVPEQCNTRFRQRGWYRAAANVCIPGHYDQQWTPAHYESTQQQVWVPFGYRHHHRWERGFNPRGI
jgi:hypothetical protein